MAMERRLEDRIRALCGKLIASDDESEEFRAIASELRAALREHTDRLRGQIREYPMTKDRRSGDPER